MKNWDNDVHEIDRLKKANEELKKDNADLRAIVKAWKLCVTPEHCHNQDEIRQATAKEILLGLRKDISQCFGEYALEIVDGYIEKYEVEE